MIRRDRNGNIILGFSWMASPSVLEERQLKSGRRYVDPRFRVCNNCVKGEDRPDVAIIGETTMPPLCERCARPVSKASL
jgi:hypothetical protein